MIITTTPHHDNIIKAQYLNRVLNCLQKIALHYTFNEKGALSCIINHSI